MRHLPRRRFLKTMLAGSMSLPLACAERPSPRFDGKVAARFVDSVSPERGHLLRQPVDRTKYSSAAETTVDALVIGGGISGLAACWKLQQAGVQRVLLVELADQLGGDASAGQADGLTYPRGAHYINVPPAEADCVHEVLSHIDVITGYDAAGRPIVHPDHLLRWPDERTWTEDGWVEGLDPFADAAGEELDQLHAFEDDMLRWTLYRGQDDRRAFSMPLAYSTADADVRELDGLSMADYCQKQGWDGARLGWLVDQACKDDYGGLAGDVSAWAGIHYFACRYYDRRVRNEYPADTLTWPGGNQFLADRLANDLGPESRWLSTAVVRLHVDNNVAEAWCIHGPTGERRRVRAQSVVYAGKLYTAPHVVADLPTAQRTAISELDYVPWLVAAVRLSAPLADRGMAWDNVLMDSPSVGYVSARHQSPQGGQPMGEVLVYYLPLLGDSKTARRELLQDDPQPWARRVMEDLMRAHPDLPDLVQGIDICRWGHGMVRPVPGSIWGANHRLRRQPFGPIAFASSEVGGLPLFEEALFAGIAAAEHSLDVLDTPYLSSLQGMPSRG